MSEEIWLPIPSAPGWLASSHGRVWHPPFQIKMPNGGAKTMTTAPTFGFINQRLGRHQIWINGKTRKIALLVCEAFHGPKPDPRWECMHLDEDKTNNVPSNLAWGTKSENQKAPKVTERRRAFMTGKVIAKRKLSDEQVREIREIQGRTQRDIAAEYGVSRALIGYIRTRAQRQRVI